MDDDDGAETARINEFEVRLSQFIADSKMPAYDAIVAIGISLARVLYGLEFLHGKEVAVDACDLLDKTMTKSWDDFAANRGQLQ